MIKNNMIVGIIGGSGIEKIIIPSKTSRNQIKTPYGFTSSGLLDGIIGNQKVVFIYRHGKKHTIPPGKVPYKANIWALKKRGCNLIIATTACGSLREKYKPGNMVFVDQIIDFTKNRPLTYFEKQVVHTPMSQPFDIKIRESLIKTAKKLNYKYHPSGTMITIEGPRFSTRAESLMFKKWGADLINMTTIPEVTLANEIGIPYQAVALVTDYDCWRKKGQTVSMDLILKRMKDNGQKVSRLISEVIKVIN